MTARIDIDRLHAVWSVGDEEEALALIAREGFEIPRSGGGLVEKYRHADGWEIRLVYATAGRNRERANKRAYAARSGRAEASE